MNVKPEVYIVAHAYNSNNNFKLIEQAEDKAASAVESYNNGNPATIASKSVLVAKLGGLSVLSTILNEAEEEIAEQKLLAQRGDERSLKANEKVRDITLECKKKVEEEIEKIQAADKPPNANEAVDHAINALNIAIEGVKKMIK